MHFLKIQVDKTNVPWIIFQGKEREDVAAVDEANTVLYPCVKEIKLKITPNKN